MYSMGSDEVWLAIVSLYLIVSIGIGDTYVGSKGGEIRVFIIKNISEDAPVGTVLDTFKPHDASLPTYNVTFRINNQSDPKKQFTIDQDGVLKVAQQLDMEDISSYKLIIEAFDAAGNVGTQMVAVYLQDVNDNGPEPYTVPRTCIFMENTLSTANQTNSCEIRAIDRDSSDYGPPFFMQVDPSFKYGAYLNVTFDPNGDGGNGSMTIRPVQAFDHEAAQSENLLDIPLILTDRAGKVNLASVYVVVKVEQRISMLAVVPAFAFIILMIALVVFMVLASRRKNTAYNSVHPEEGTRDNMRQYGVEGGGEADNDRYSIGGLRKLVQ